jgi:hypothetical protein
MIRLSLFQRRARPAGLAFTLFVQASVSLLAADALPGRVSIQVDGDRVVHEMAGGIGASWHAIEAPIPVVGGRSHGGSGWGGYPPAEDEAAWRQIDHLADWLGLDFCRVEFEQRIYEPRRHRFAWDSPEMRILYRILDWCQRRQADVFLQQMWANVDWNAFPEFRGDPVKRVHSGPRSLKDFAEGLAGLVEHLLKVKHYTCIKWLCINNEPGYDWSWWQRPPNQPMSLRDGLAAVRAALDRRGIHLPLSGPDWTDLPPLEPSKIDFDQFIGAYDLHCYNARFDWMQGPGYPLQQAARRLSAWRRWSGARGKPLFLSELGSMVFGWGGTNAGPRSFPAAIKDAELVLRGLNLGVDGFNRWSFINRGDLDGQWQMIETWNAQTHSLLKKFTPASNSFFVYGMLSRFTAKHSRVLKTAVGGGQIGGLPRVFAAALRSPQDKLTVVVLNDAPCPWKARLSGKDLGVSKLFKYQVTSAERDQPELRILPLESLRTAGSGATFEVALPPMSLTLFSSYCLAADTPGIVHD